MSIRFATIGHSDRSFDEFLAMLRAAGVDLVVDVRAFPRSRANPAFNIDLLPRDLAQFDIGYRHFPALGGRRTRQRAIDEESNALWRVRSFHNYADYALSDAFADAFDALVRLGESHRPALMCAEALWWRCHRRIIADHLLFAGYEVDHLMGPGHSEPAVPTPGARKAPDGRIVYPRPG